MKTASAEVPPNSTISEWLDALGRLLVDAPYGARVSIAVSPEGVAEVTAQWDAPND